MRKLFIILAILVFSACSGVKYTEQGLADRVGAGDVSLDSFTVDSQWWKAYNDEELNRLIALAEERNIDYAVSALNITIALYNANLQGLDLFPTLSGSLGASVSKDLKSGDDFSKSFSGEAGLNYEIDLYGKVRKSRDAAELEYSATLLDRENQHLVLINSLIDVYFNMAYLQASKRLTEDNLETYNKLYEIAKIKFELGKTDSSPVLQAEQSVISAQSTLLDINDQIKSAEQTLRNLLNLSPSEELNINYPQLAEVNHLDVDIDVPLAVLSNRPDLKASELRLQKTFKNVEIQNRSWYPSISLRAAVNSSSDKVGTVLHFPFFSGGLTISLPFLDWNKVRYNIKVSEAEYESSLLNFESTINTALNELAYYYYAYGVTQDNLENSEKNYAINQKLTEYHSARYDAGYSEMSDLLGALNSEKSSEKDVLNNIYQLIKYENMVYKTMAGRYTEADVQ